MSDSKLSFGKIIHLIGKVLSWALFCILLLAAAFLLYYFIATKIYASKGAGYEPKFSIYTIASPSMTPTLKVYDAIINVKVDSPQDLQVGDIITFVSTSLLSPGMTLTHRIVGITQDEEGKVCYTTQGDFNPVADQACAKYSNIIGKVIFKIPQLGRIQMLLASKIGWLLFILIPALYIICRDILKITKLTAIKNTASKISESKKKDPKKEQLEKERKMELKRKLKIDNNTSKQEYYKEPIVKSIDKRRTTDNNNQKNKKKGKKS